MATIGRFEDLDVWKKARALANAIHLKTLNGSFASDYALRDQINRSSGSIMDNIAEGFEREGRNEFIQFLSYSKSSAAEVRSQLHRAFDRAHITKAEFDDLYTQALDVGKMLGGFMKYLKSSDIKGLKYKTSEPEVDYNNLKFEI